MLIAPVHFIIWRCCARTGSRISADKQKRNKKKKESTKEKTVATSMQVHLSQSISSYASILAHTPACSQRERAIIKGNKKALRA